MVDDSHAMGIAKTTGPDAWEAAYLRFETSEQASHRALRRLQKLGVAQLPRDARVVELFCGRGNGLHALASLGFTKLEGIDFSPRLVALYSGPAKCYVSDCRQLPFPDHSRDVLIVQGGLHHLPTLPESLAQTLAEIHRVTRKEGRVVIVEPWLTPFLRLVHWTLGLPLVRCRPRKLEALASMIEYERNTYEQWLKQPELILDLSHKYFSPVHESFAWGKWVFVGAPV